MGLEGTLQTLHLPNLIQLHCNQQHTAMVRLVRNEREAWLAFDQGDLVYANTGALTDEEAVYDLLGWEEREFRVGQIETIHPANITAPWSVLLVDRLQRAARASAALCSLVFKRFLKRAKQKMSFGKP